MKNRDYIVKGKWCLNCKYLKDFDVDSEDNIVIICELEQDYPEEEGKKCPFFEE